MPWIIWNKPKRVVYLEQEADALMKYADYEEFEPQEEAFNIVDIIRDMEDDEMYAAALKDCCEDTIAYVKDHFHNVLEYQVWDSEYRSANSLYMDIADMVAEDLLDRGMARMKLVPVVAKEIK